MTSEREKFLRGVNFNGTAHVNSHIFIKYPLWEKYGKRLNWLEDFSPYVSVNIDRSPGREAYSEETDRWGCHWIYPLRGFDGQCINHPISSWSDLSTYQLPDPDDFTDWEQANSRIEKAKSEGRVARGATDHGFIYLRLTYLRGFGNFMLDVAENRPELDELIRRVESYWFQVIKHWVDIGIDVINFGDDLGLQMSLPISPDAWRRYIKPSYKRIFSYCRSYGIHTYLHTDGCIVDIIPNLIECGVSILNLQDLVNGLDNIRRLAKGKVFIHLDIDRQRITVFGKLDEIDAHILSCVQMLGSPKGGLDMRWAVHPPTPIENIEAGAKAMHKYSEYWV
jgi:uroporphyrinogen decarboxylase